MTWLLCLTFFYIIHPAALRHAAYTGFWSSPSFWGTFHFSFSPSSLISRHLRIRLGCTCTHIYTAQTPSDQQTYVPSSVCLSIWSQHRNCTVENLQWHTVSSGQQKCCSSFPSRSLCRLRYYWSFHSSILSANLFWYFLFCTLMVRVLLFWPLPECFSRRNSVHSSPPPPPPPLYGVPQGSVIGPVLFVLYIYPLFTIVDAHLLSHHSFSDDNQLYITGLASELSNLVSSTQSCIS